MNEILEFLEVSVGDGEQVNNRHHLLLQRQRIVFTQPQLSLELLTLATLLSCSQLTAAGAQVAGEG